MTGTTPSAMPKDHDAFLSAADLKELMEKHEQAKAAEQQQKGEQAAAARKALIDELRKPVEITEAQVNNAVSKFRTAAQSGLTEMIVFSFPAEVCSDGGRSINNALDGWQDTLVGKSRSIYEAWQRYLKDKGYKFHARVLDYRHGMLGDIGIVIVWAHKDS